MRKELVLLVLVACTKEATPVTKETPSDPAPVATATATATEALPAPSASTPLPSTSTSARGASTAVPAASPKGVPPAVSAAAPTLQPASTKLTGNHFTLDVASPGCAAGSACAVTLRLEATGGYHINKDYPYKLVLDPAPGVEFLGRDPGGASTFSKSAGDFVIGAEQLATMTARLTPSAKGPARVAGVYKMSVCSESNCQLEQLKISLDVPVQ